ncbi:DNA processing protein [Candidatus Planktophila limnetica]|uniref:DNA processing protein n=1 Tax=Candidatus Planktophila limnetica TaxID=573600 RepID=A0A249LG05_9ACTN|nr:DNA-processing protein DprA [Candidatus Planktophila limnetica]ASY27859.1 DNA processing protein [Candidatus Planktophila limnetica]
MNEEINSRIRLFDAIEGGSPFWSREIAEFGAFQVLNSLCDGIYDGEKFNRIITRLLSKGADELLHQVHTAQAIFITPEDALWPDPLNSLSNPPIGLVVKGDATCLSKPQLGIVGTRNPTNYGLRNAAEFASGFVDRGWVITSGGAYGIDSAAHRGALFAEGETIAVIATGIDVNYPVGNQRLFHEISESGALVSEVMPGVTAIPSRFLTRNRLIAALSNATLVVEAAFRSGSLRTARDAAELLRPVMAIPGPINSPTSEGCHRLIGERAAEIVTSVNDAVEFLSI